MFRSKMFGNKIISDEGFEVHIGTEGRDSLIYIEQRKKMHVNSESLSVERGMGIAFWKDSIKKWDSPFESESLTKEKKNQIIDNIERALRFAKFDTIHMI